jgi:hypothetical protein
MRSCHSARVGKAASASTLAQQVRKVARIDPVAAQAEARRITDSTVFVSPDELVALLADRLAESGTATDHPQFRLQYRGLGP